MCEPPASAAGALAAVRAGLEFLATADPAALTSAEQADCLRGLAACESVHLAATTRILGAFTAAGGYAADGQPTARSWLRWQTRATSAAAGATAKWARRLRAHPDVAASLAAGHLAPSVAREILDWTGQLPDEHQAGADQILLHAHRGGAELADLAALAEEITRRCARPDAGDTDDSFATRRLRLTAHYQGHAHLDADLTPTAAAAVKAVLDALGRKTGPEDDRAQPQRDHDALEEACRRLVTSGLPARAGQPTQIQLHMTLSQLLHQPETDPARAAWITANGVPAPPGADCDASIAPIVTGTLDHNLLHHLATAPYPPTTAAAGETAARAGGLMTPGLSAADLTAGGLSAGGLSAAGLTAARFNGGGAAAGVSASGSSLIDYSADGRGADDSTAAMTERATQQLLIADATALLSGPNGLAAWLRTTRLTGPAASPSLPLDLGKPTETVPAWLRRAVILRDQHCGFPGCDVPPEYCHVHHIIPRAEGGPTSLDNTMLGCAFHHLIVIHRWGWQVTLNPDGTKTAVHPHGWRTLHSDKPPTAA
jgi:Domain of unknown function (DUF222)/HNH endonuclease